VLLLLIVKKGFAPWKEGGREEGRGSRAVNWPVSTKGWKFVT
jgi:hypothetical protein